MRRLQIVLATVIAAAALVAAGPAAAKPRDKSKAANPAGKPANPAGKPTDSSQALSGGVKISVHTHSSDDPVFPGLLFPTDRLSFDFSEGESFSYSSRTCGGSAPFNDVGLDFRPDYPGVDDDGTAAVRHRAEGTVTQVQGDRGTIEGTITTVLCVTENGVQTESEHVIVTEYRARYRRVSDNEVQLTGRFAISPTRSTGTFEDLTGHGSIKAILTCLAHERNPSQPSCARRGEFTDFVGLRGDTSKPAGEAVPGLQGHFRDPTVETL